MKNLVEAAGKGEEKKKEEENVGTHDFSPFFKKKLK